MERKNSVQRALSGAGRALLVWALAAVLYVGACSLIADGEATTGHGTGGGGAAADADADGSSGSGGHDSGLGSAGSLGTDGAGPDDAGNSCSEPFATRRLGGPGYDRAYAVAALPDGSVYVTGLFSETARFDEVPLESLGGTDVFVARLDSDGRVAWARRGGGLGDDQGYAIAVLRDGSVAIAGAVEGSARFGDHTLEPEGGEASDGLFIGRYAPDGTLLWVEQARGAFPGRGNAIGAHGDGSLYVTGSFLNTARFGSQQLESRGVGDTFLAKYDASGSLLWVERAGGTDGDWSNAVGVAKDGSAYIAGNTQGDATFGNVALSDESPRAMFLAKYAPNGQVLWARTAGGRQADYVYANSLASLADGRVYVAGTVLGTAVFTDASVSGEESAFIAKYEADGAVDWVRAAQGRSTALAVAALPNGSAYLSGGMIPGTHFGDTVLDQDSAGTFTLFLAKYDANGAVDWAKQAVHAGDSIVYNFGRSIALAPGCSAFVAGGFTDSWTFDSTTLDARGDEDAFVAKFEP